jgi:hypothetical protein
LGTGYEPVNYINLAQDTFHVDREMNIQVKKKGVRFPNKLSDYQRFKKHSAL